MAHYHHTTSSRTCVDGTPAPVLLQQVAMLANSLMRLSHKMQHNHGRLPHDEQALLYHHMHLLDGVYLQLQVTTTLPAAASSPNAYSRSELHQHHQQQQEDDGCYSGNVMTATLARDSHTRPASPGAVGRRRTKRQFTKTCHRCDTSFTSQWRTGPSGPSTLCNACGIRYARHARQAFRMGRERDQEAPAAETSQAPPQTESEATAVQSRNSIGFLLN